MAGSWLDAFENLNQSDDEETARQESALGQLDASLGLPTKRVASGDAVLRKYADGSNRVGTVQVVSGDQATCRVSFEDGGVEWAPLSEVVRTDSKRLAELRFEQTFGKVLDETPVGINRVAIRGAEPPVKLPGRFDEPGVLENEGVSGMGKSRDVPRGDHPERATANADFQQESEDMAIDERPPALTAANDAKLQAASKDVYNMVMDAWAERGREAGAGTCDRVASVFFGSKRFAQVNESSWFNQGTQDQSPEKQDTGKFGDSELTQVLAMSKDMPKEAPIVHKMIIDYLAEDPSILDQLGPGTYMKALDGAVDYWRRVNPAKLERVRKQVAPDITEPVSTMSDQGKPQSWWDRVKMAVSPLARAQKDVDTFQGAPGSKDVVKGRPKIDQGGEDFFPGGWNLNKAGEATISGRTVRSPLQTMVNEPVSGTLSPSQARPELVQDLMLSYDKTMPPRKPRPPSAPRRAMKASSEVVARMASEIVARSAARKADEAERDANGFYYGAPPWGIKVDNATSTGHWLMVDVSWPAKDCPVDHAAPGGMANMSYLIKGRLQGWMQQQRNLGIFAEPQLLSLDVSKRTARLTVAVIGASSYPQAVMEVSVPALKDDDNE